MQEAKKIVSISLYLLCLRPDHKYNLPYICIVIAMLTCQNSCNTCFIWFHTHYETCLCDL